MNKGYKRATLTEELFSITGEGLSAIILNRFLEISLDYHDIDSFLDSEHAERAGIAVERRIEGWVRYTSREIADDIMSSKSRKTIDRRINNLVEAGWLAREQEESSDRAYRYRPNILGIELELLSNGYSLATVFGPRYAVVKSLIESLESGPYSTNGQNDLSNGQNDHCESRQTDDVYRNNVQGNNVTQGELFHSSRLARLDETDSLAADQGDNVNNDPGQEDKKPTTRRLSQREVVTDYLTQVFLDATGLYVPEGISHAAFNKLWRGPLWEIHQQICGGDSQIARRAVHHVCRYMRNEELTFDSPIQIIKVARNLAANRKIGEGAPKLEQSDDGALWI